LVNIKVNRLILFIIFSVSQLMLTDHRSVLTNRL